MFTVTPRISSGIKDLAGQQKIWKSQKQNRMLINNSETRVYPIIFTEVKELICMKWGNLILTSNLASVPSRLFYSESQYYFYQY